MTRSDDVRLVPMTREQRDHLDAFTDGSVAEEIVAAWDAAPADPTEAVRSVIHWPPTNPPMTTTGGFTDRHIEAVLAALGKPGSP